MPAESVAETSNTVAPTSQQGSWGGAPAEKPSAAGPYAGTTPPGKAVPSRMAAGEAWADSDPAASDPYVVPNPDDD